MVISDFIKACIAACEGRSASYGDFESESHELYDSESFVGYYDATDCGIWVERWWKDYNCIREYLTSDGMLYRVTINRLAKTTQLWT